jgi:hypothetical protein
MSAIAFKLPNAANKALENSLFIFARDVLDATIAYVREKNIDLRRGDLDATALATAIGCAAVVKTVEKPKAAGRKPKSKVVADDAAFPKYDWFPFCNVVYAGRCMGMQMRGGLMNQCLAAPKEGCEFCAKCEAKRIGDIRTRVCPDEPEKTKEFVLTTVSKSGKTTRKTPTSFAKYLADIDKRKMSLPQFLAAHRELVDGKVPTDQLKSEVMMAHARAEAERLSSVLDVDVAIAEWDTKIEAKARGRKSGSSSSGESKDSKAEIDVESVDCQKVLKDLDELNLANAKKMLKAVAAKTGADMAEIKKLTKKADVVEKLKELCENYVATQQMDDVSGDDEEAGEASDEEAGEASDEEAREASDEEAGEASDEEAREASDEDDEEVEFPEDDEEEEEEEEDEEARLRERRAANLREYDIQDYKKTEKEIAIKCDVVYAYDSITETVGDAIGKVKGGKVGILAKFKEDYETKKDKKDKTKTRSASD